VVSTDSRPDPHSSALGASTAPGGPASILFRSALYCIVDDVTAARSGWTAVDLARAVLDGGAQVLQVRAKHATGREFLALTESVLELGHTYGAVVIVNDRADVARLARADGVHVGPQDLPIAGVRDIVGPACLVGLSTYNEAEIVVACVQPISYLAVGPVYPTMTKDTGYTEVGLGLVTRAAEALREAAGPGRLPAMPLVAIGGITIERARDVLAAGATSVAIISDLLAGGDPVGRVRAYLAHLAE
jgi:thiamine-phosphate pyrophosphorylase